jgi:hypothetical protein
VVLDNTINGQSFNFHLPFQADSTLFDPELWLVSAQNIVTRVSEQPTVAENLLIVAPNPASTQITLRSVAGLHGPAEVTIMDELGRVVMQFENTQLSAPISIAGLSSGVYAVTLRSAGQEWRTRFVRE